MTQDGIHATDTGLGNLSREDTVSLINRAYNHESTASYKEYKKRLYRLPDETLSAILRIITRSEQERDGHLLVRQFSQRSNSSPDSIVRFAAFIEREYFSVRTELRDTYGVDAMPMAVCYSAAGVITFEKRHQFTVEQQHQALLVLSAVENTNSIEPIEWERGDVGRYVWIKEDAFIEYVSADHSDEYRRRVVTALCSGQQYNRFLEVVEHVSGTVPSKPLLTGIL